jgi:succinate dehydrogenase/fumarate reductase iron-sulfur protein
LQDKRVSRIKILRSEPSAKKGRRYETYEVPYEKGARVLELLMTLREEMGYDIAYRAACRTRLCGLCGVLVNGKQTLACWNEALPEMTIEPLPHFPVIKDLTMDRSLYDERIQKIAPYLIPKEPVSTKGPFAPETFYRIKPSEMSLPIEMQSCIECLLCVSACPMAEGGRAKFAGPAALVRLAQFAFDPRDGLDRIKIAYDEHVYDCTRCYACEEVCPVSIPIVRGIVSLEQMANRKSASKEYKHLKEMVKGYL